ncbi:MULTISPECIES: cation diffusion facilitator family transporter [Mesobacillus]|uniref:cation diffusion facilitator family transporter n=1 Tax=Mesobacillus TaxID=2675231 RepID=UPI001786C3D0|nr:MULTISPECIES: cation diffusion facilitator family transporter [Mesobacillus]MCM3573414.1 cation diffusion facilitator family transporter [Mesobacillus subterraneus]UYZ23048.1 cation diffusion facilitator family transporter [Mesobacillus jeotgali]
MSSMIEFFKRGNKSSGIAALGNTFLAIIKGVAAGISGSGTMLATTLHSVADALNQFFVFIGSAISEKEATKRFPTGFGRVVNLFVLVAVIIISIMAYETVIKGWELIQHPKASSNLWLNVMIMTIAVLVDGLILIKAMKEIAHETRSEAKGFGIVGNAFKNVSLAAPPTRLVFYEDLIATFGALLALFSIVMAHVTGFYLLDGIGTLLIGILLIGIALKIGYENTVGLIGVSAPKVVEDRIANLILSDPDVIDINTLRIVQEGRQYHVESYLELRKGLTLADADDIKFRVRDSVLKDPDVDDVIMGIIEADDVQTWKV